MFFIFSVPWLLRWSLTLTWRWPDLPTMANGCPPHTVRTDPILFIHSHFDSDPLLPSVFHFSWVGRILTRTLFYLLEKLMIKGVGGSNPGFRCPRVEVMTQCMCERVNRRPLQSAEGSCVGCWKALYKCSLLTRFSLFSSDILNNHLLIGEDCVKKVKLLNKQQDHWISGVWFVSEIWNLLSELCSSGCCCFVFVFNETLD